jgi:hypothetical protein
MSGGMDLDIRIPIGLMFLILGPLLLVVGLVEHAAITEYTGLGMTLFGAPMLLFGWMSARRAGK